MEKIFNYVFIFLATLVCINIINVVFTAWLDCFKGDDKDKKNN